MEGSIWNVLIAAGVALVVPLMTALWLEGAEGRKQLQRYKRMS